jgi:hypothetical protein
MQKDYCATVIDKVHQLSIEIQPKIFVVDCEQAKDLAYSHRISIVPTLLIFNKGIRMYTKICTNNFDEVLKIILEIDNK